MDLFADRSGHYGRFGGAYTPEILHQCLQELRETFYALKDDPKFWSEYEALMGETISPDRVVVIGDTPADVECATTHGARCLAVASGSYSCAQLEGANPTYCLQDLSDVQTVLGLLFDDGQYE